MKSSWKLLATLMLELLHGENMFKLTLGKVPQVIYQGVNNMVSTL